MRQVMNEGLCIIKATLTVKGGQGQCCKEEGEREVEERERERE